MPIEVKSFASQADEAKDMPNARMEAVNVLGQRVMKLTLAPDWKWSTDIKPIVGTRKLSSYAYRDHNRRNYSLRL